MAKAEHHRALPVLLWIAGIALAVAVVLAVRSLTHDPIRVRVAPVTYQTLAQTAATNGKVEPVEEFQAHAPFPGVIQRIYVDVGDKVTAGKLLVKMDDSEALARLASAKAALASAELSYSQMQQGGSAEERSTFQSNLQAAMFDQQNAARSLATMQRLQAKGAASQSEVQAAQERVDAANTALANAKTRSTLRYEPIDLTTAKAHVDDARAAVAAAQDALAQAIIRSPLSGTVYSVPVSEYDFVPSGDDLLDIADLNRIQVRAYFDEPEIGKLVDGQPVKIVWDAKPTETWHGHILRAPTTVITYGTRNVGECIITVDDARGELLPNTNVTVTVTERERKNTMSIPREALHTEGANDFVYRLVNGKLARTPVQVGIVNLTNVEILSGLNVHDVVVLGPIVSGQELTQGLEVKPVQ
jgi:HlyD family secretion protein